MKEGVGLGSKNRKGQITIFVILAIVIVVAGILIYFLYPKIQATSNSLEDNPKAYFQNCVEDSFQQNAKVVGLQGGSLNPESSIKYGGNKVEFLCYTNKYYDKCAPQRVLLISHIEDEIKKSLNKKVNDCFNSMDSDYKSKGYTTSLSPSDFDVNILPNKIILHSNSTFTLTKDSTNKYNSFDVVLNNNLYELASIARVIVNWEKTYGDSDPTYFMNFYPELKIEKKQLSDGVRVYTIENRNTKDKFQFASRSVVWPLGVNFNK